MWEYEAEFLIDYLAAEAPINQPGMGEDSPSCQFPFHQPTYYQVTVELGRDKNHERITIQRPSHKPEVNTAR